MLKKIGIENTQNVTLAVCPMSNSQEKASDTSIFINLDSEGR